MIPSPPLAKPILPPLAALVTCGGKNLNPAAAASASVPLAACAIAGIFIPVVSAGNSSFGCDYTYAPAAAPAATALARSAFKSLLFCSYVTLPAASLCAVPPLPPVPNTSPVILLT